MLHLSHKIILTSERWHVHTMDSAWQLSDIDSLLIKLAFQEDLGKPFQDVTTSILFNSNSAISLASVISKHSEPVVVCGLPIVKELLRSFATPIEFNTPFKDGDMLYPGQTLFFLKGDATTLLMAERTILNFLQRLCAVATLTKKFADKIKHTPTKILDTRKTLPGFRHLDKYAVRCGGGVNHRMGLYDAIMIKDTHIDSLGGIALALDKLPNDILKNYPVIIEVRDIQELLCVLTKGLHKTTRVLLDNMTELEIAECVVLCKDKMKTEASGNINLENVAKIAETGVNFVSIGKLTHSAGNVNLSMKCDIA
jgi:nicotinate-nucleotide pyrophosphorylase (carboxylating)